MRGSKRVPVLSIEQSGRAQIDLWCKRGQGQATLAGDTITIAIGAMTDEPCTPERAQADEDMLAALAGATNWSARGDVVTLARRKAAAIPRGVELDRDCVSDAVLSHGKASHILPLLKVLFNLTPAERVAFKHHARVQTAPPRRSVH